MIAYWKFKNLVDNVTLYCYNEIRNVYHAPSLASHCFQKFDERSILNNKTVYLKNIHFVTCMCIVYGYILRSLTEVEDIASNSCL